MLFFVAQVKNTVCQIEDLRSIEKQLSDSDQTCQAYSLTEKAVQVTKRYPTGFQDGKLTGSLRSCRKRRETFAAAQKIHGSSVGSSLPGAVGLLDTALDKCNQGLLVDVLSANKKFNKHVMPAVYKRNLNSYELSEENMLRSISVYYSGGIAGEKSVKKFIEIVATKQVATIRAVSAFPPMNALFLGLFLITSSSHSLDQYL